MLNDIAKRIEVSGALLRSQQYLERGEYDAALKENERVLFLSAGKRPGDEALFNLGLIYAHHDNPGRDHEKSLFFFRALLKDFPNSPRYEQAKIWVKTFGSLNQEIEKLSRSIDQSRKRNAELRREIFQLKSSIDVSRKGQEDLMGEIRRLQRMLDRSRQVDLEVEQRRRIDTR